MNRVLMKLSEKPFAVIAHRGGSGLAPENTLLGVQRSLEVGSDLIEIDVQITLDRIAVVFHDEDLRRIAGINASIREMKYSDLSDIKINGEKIPTLEEVLSFSIDRIGVLIEVKKPGDEIHIMDLVRRLDASQWIAIISFHTEVLRNVKRLDP
ncbi:MAG: glycerophosphodiester phosphodiesterase family protein, partial [Sulfolobales archaeon]